MRNKSEQSEERREGMTPRARLDAVDAIMVMTSFADAYKTLDGDERDEFENLREAAAAANDPAVAQHFFEQIKNFFVKKMDYDPSLFDDERLVQFVLQFNKVMAEDEERDLIAQKIMPEVVERINMLRKRLFVLKQESPRGPGTEGEINDILHELGELTAAVDSKVGEKYNKKHSLSIN